ncbi:hypothetical protein V2J09_009377 [Rumex salicifolius]
MFFQYRLHEPKLFDCTSFVHNHHPHRGKLDPKAIKCIFLGYSSTQKDYKCYDPSSQKLFTSIDVTFDEGTPFFSMFLEIVGDLSPRLFNESFPALDLPQDLPIVQVSPEAPPVPLVQSYPQVYTRRQQAILRSPQVSSPPPRSVLDIPTVSGTPSDSLPDSYDLDLPIVVKKQSKECTKRPLYPLSHHFIHDPREPHLTAAYRILRYLKGSPRKGILFRRGNELKEEAFTDADYAGSVVDRRSTSSFCVFLGGNLITWRSKKQNVMARSSAKSEFRALTQEGGNLNLVTWVLEYEKLHEEVPHPTLLLDIVLNLSRHIVEYLFKEA